MNEDASMVLYLQLPVQAHGAETEVRELDMPGVRYQHVVRFHVPEYKYLGIH